MSGLLTIVTVLGGRVVKKHDEEIASIKSGIKDLGGKLDLKLDRETYEINRQEQRANVIELHRKVEQIGRDGEQRHRELMQVLLEQRGRRRAGD